MNLIYEEEMLPFHSAWELKALDAAHPRNEHCKKESRTTQRKQLRANGKKIENENGYVRVLTFRSTAE
jgi:hypothetical protein